MKLTILNTFKGSCLQDILNFLEEVDIPPEVIAAIKHDGCHSIRSESENGSTLVTDILVTHDED